MSLHQWPAPETPGRDTAASATAPARTNTHTQTYTFIHTSYQTGALFQNVTYPFLEADDYYYSTFLQYRGRKCCLI